MTKKHLKLKPRTILLKKKSAQEIPLTGVILPKDKLHD